MIIISHRAKLSRDPEPHDENNPTRIRELLARGYGVEVDLKIENGYCYLGHPSPAGDLLFYIVESKFLMQKNLWIHCKNIDALEFCKDWNIRHYFFHNTDDVTITSSGYFWTYPNKSLPLTKYSIPVVYHRDSDLWSHEDLEECFAICTDEPEFFDELFNGRQKAVSNSWT